MNTLSKWGLGANLGFGLGLALTLSASFTMAAAQELDSIAAIVNDDIVLQTDFNTRLGKIKQQFKNSNTKAPDIETLKSQVLDQLIIENLQLQLAAKKGVYIADPSLELAIESIAKNNQMSLDQLTQAITDSGETMIQFRDRIRQ
jgi:peptidyl-prolyl cis-trans isomerase SurA